MTAIRVLLGLTPFAFGASILWLGQDISWDLRNYHVYNPFAFLFGRMGHDVAVAHVATYYNPLLYLPFYHAVVGLPPKAVGFLLGFLPGLNAWLIYAITRRAVDPGDSARARWYCFALTAAAMLGMIHLAEIATSLEVQRLQAGLVPVEGPGVRVELDDSAREVPSNVDPNLLIVHDYEIRDVVNLLWAAGAEAIAVSGERVAANTAIYCVGSTILVNDTRLSPPYVIEAIGPPDKLYGAVTQALSLVKLKEVVERYGVQLKVSRVDALRLPAYTGEIRAQYAVPSSSMR